MRSLLAYLLAVSAFLGTTYVGLEWLSEPTHPIVQHTANKATAETAIVSERPRVENSAGSGSNSEPSEADLKPPPNQPAPAPPPEPGQLKGDSQPPAASNSEDSHSGRCAPLGLTAQGNLVFPLECHELLTRSQRPENPSHLPPVRAIRHRPRTKIRQQNRPRNLPAREQPIKSRPKPALRASRKTRILVRPGNTGLPMKLPKRFRKPESPRGALSITPRHPE